MKRSPLTIWYHMPTSRRFVIHSPIRDLETFRRLAEQASVLKIHGEVATIISTLSEKSRYEIPSGGSPWHEYASLNPTLAKFFPHPAIGPHIPAGHVARNCLIPRIQSSVSAIRLVNWVAWNGYRMRVLKLFLWASGPCTTGDMRPRIPRPI